MDPSSKRFFDSICPNLPVLHGADQDIFAELAANLTSQTVSTSAFSAEKIAGMIVGSQHLRRLAIKHGDEINSIMSLYKLVNYTASNLVTGTVIYIPNFNIRGLNNLNRHYKTCKGLKNNERQTSKEEN